MIKYHHLQVIDSVIVEQDFEKNDFMWLCMDTGYQTFENLLKEGTDTQKAFDDIQLQDIRDSKHVDDNGRVWYKIILLTPFSVLMPSNDDWCVYTMISTDENDSEAILSHEDVDGNVIFRKPDTESEVRFSGNEFAKAFDRYQLLNAMVGGKLLEDKSEEE